jgi:YtkA-like
VHSRDKRPIDGTTIIDAKTDMGPSGMAAMSGMVEPARSEQPGFYRFVIDTAMSGKWQLVLTAKVEGEVRPITGTITYDAQ